MAIAAKRSRCVDGHKWEKLLPRVGEFYSHGLIARV